MTGLINIFRGIFARAGDVSVLNPVIPSFTAGTKVITIGFSGFHQAIQDGLEKCFVRLHRPAVPICSIPGKLTDILYQESVSSG